MKVCGYAPLHYGSEYLKQSLEAILPLCDKFFILYAKHPSHGHGTMQPCPESEQELKDVAFGVEGKEKIVWVDGQYHNEGEQRNHIFRLCGGYDMLVTCDSDEVVDTAEFKKAIEQCYKREEREFGIDGYINFFRNFDNICQDGFRPVRIINLNNHVGTRAEVKATIYHFGCAQSEKIMRYKYKVHGHADEIRKGWLDEVFYSDETQNLHPVAHGLWNLVTFDKSTLPDTLKTHSNYNKAFIK